MFLARPYALLRVPTEPTRCCTDAASSRNPVSARDALPGPRTMTVRRRARARRCSWRGSAGRAETSARVVSAAPARRIRTVHRTQSSCQRHLQACGDLAEPRQGAIGWPRAATKRRPGSGPVLGGPQEKKNQVTMQFHHVRGRAAGFSFSPAG